VDDEWGQLGAAVSGFPTVGQRPFGRVPVEALATEPAEQPHHRQVVLAVTAVAGVDQPRPTYAVDHPVSGPQVAV
jgi:hypothetical protein